MKRPGRSAAALAALVVAALAGPGLLSPVHAQAPTDPAPLPWLHVAHPAGAPAQIVDEAGRTMILRGPNLRGIEDDYYPIAGGVEPGPAPQYPVDPTVYANGACPLTRPGAGEPPLCQADLAAIRAQGFDFIRLPISWSLLEPSPGQYSPEYLDRIAQVVGWARDQGVYVLLDMHQDDYSRFIPGAPESPNHADGAPAWAVMTDGLPAGGLLGQGLFSPAVDAAFTNFWVDAVPGGVPQGEAPGPGLEDHYLGALMAVADRFKADPTVVGYELMNEPFSGLLPPVVFSTTHLYPFYRRAINVLTGATVGANRQAYFFEPMAIRNLEDAPDQLPLPFSSYPNLVYAPHDYTHVFTLDREIGIPPALSPYPLSYEQPYVLASLEARLFGSALLIGEYGEFSGNPTTFGQVVGGMTAAQDKYLVGSSYWAWTGGAVPAVLTRVYPRATAGTLERFTYNPASHAFAMTAVSGRAVTVGDRGDETEISLPAIATGLVTVGGAATLDVVMDNADGTRSAFVAPTGGGSYTVNVAP